MIKEKQHFLVNTKYPQPTKKIQTLLDPNADIFNLNTPCQFIINVNAQISVRVHLDYECLMRVKIKTFGLERIQNTHSRLKVGADEVEPDGRRKADPALISS